MSRSRTSICIGSLRVIAFAIVAACGGHKQPAIAELARADGPVEREVSGASTWATASVGTGFYLGDAVRTADGTADLKLAGTQLIVMSPHTVLRFGAGRNNSTDVKVDLGAIDIVNSGAAGLEIGNVTITPGGKIRITSSNVELVLGHASVQAADGKTIDLSIGSPMDLELGPSKITAIDAGIDATPQRDAAVEATEGGAAHYEITGKRAELQRPGETKWAPLAEGPGTLALGTKLRLGANTKAKLVSGATTLELAGGSRITVASKLLIGMELGIGNASVDATTEGALGVPGGVVHLDGGATGAEVRVDVDARGEAKVTMVHGQGKLLAGGTDATPFDVAAGESATMLGTGTINPGVVIPKYFDFRIASESGFTLHDPRGSTALKFDFTGKCPTGGVAEIDHDARFRVPRVSEGKDSANLMAQGGGWAYRVRCLGGGVVASGRIAVVRDEGRRALPPKPGKNAIDADGRNYSISYQSLIPDLEIHYKGPGTRLRLHLATGGAEEIFDGASSTIEVPGGKLKEATYTYWVEHDGIKQDKMTTLKIKFDQTAAQVYIESPLEGAPFGAALDVAGAALPGWTAKIDSIEIPIDARTRRFKATVTPPSAGALAIRLSHPQRGVHYYLRRGPDK